MKSTRKTFLSITLSVFVMVGLIPVSQASQVVVQQGDLVELVNDAGDYKKHCTIGYIDHERHVAHIAAHCAYDAQNAHIHGQYVGRVDVNPGYFHDRSEDTAIIQLGSHIAIGENIHSGDISVTSFMIFPGDELCTYSRMNDSVQCGVVQWNFDMRRRVSAYIGNTQLGDSGGPTWIKGKGYYGVISTKNDVITSAVRISYMR